MSEPIIKAFLHEASATVNDLAVRDGWPLVRFEVEGKIHTANSYWAATDWLKSKGLARAPHRWISE